MRKVKDIRKYFNTMPYKEEKEIVDELEKCEKRFNKERNKYFIKQWFILVSMIVLFDLLMFIVDVLTNQSFAAPTLWLKFLQRCSGRHLYIENLYPIGIILVSCFVMFKYYTKEYPSFDLQHLLYKCVNKLKETSITIYLNKYSKLFKSKNILDLNNFEEKVYLTNSEALDYLQKQESKIINFAERLYSPIEKDTYRSLKNDSIAYDEVTLRHYIHFLNDQFTYATQNQFKEVHNYINLVYKNLDTLVALYRDDLKILQKGVDGENAINDSLIKYQSEIINLKNIILPTYQNDIKTSEIDNLLITPYGLFVLEVKNWGKENDILKIEQDGRWLRGRGNNFNVVKSVSEQNIFHCRTLKNILKESSFLQRIHLNESIPIYPLIVIANDDITIENHSTEKVIRASQIYSEMINYEKVLSNEQMLMIKTVLNEKELPENKFPQRNYERLIQLMEEDLNFFNQELILTMCKETDNFIDNDKKFYPNNLND